mmetsp:Transcript_26481/g.42447  ORF Transcript_26481/g.42447 Transcript_26481/m.42447 type:complete len:200 (+) Transcript_26481:213-812(+)
MWVRYLHDEGRAHRRNEGARIGAPGPGLASLRTRVAHRPRQTSCGAAETLTKQGYVSEPVGHLGRGPHRVRAGFRRHCSARTRRGVGGGNDARRAGVRVHSTSQASWPGGLQLLRGRVLPGAAVGAGDGHRRGGGDSGGVDRGAGAGGKVESSGRRHRAASSRVRRRLLCARQEKICVAAWAGLTVMHESSEWNERPGR